MKKQLLFLALSLTMILNGWSQSITVASIDPSTPEVDADFTVNISYSTDNANDIIYVGLELKNAAGWVATVGEGNMVVGTSGTDVATSMDITVPSSATPSADLEDGQYYELKVELNMENWGGWLVGDYPLITLVPSGTLGVEDNILANQFALYPNPASEILNIKNKKGLAIKSINISNVLGKIVYSNNNAINLNSIDVSSFSSGLYVFSINTSESAEVMKFFKN